ncbi:MAG: PIN domain-containing protein [Flavobacteriales bacterium]|nr:PIN domain-containing protein [Flavobacteriales bacterium]
MTRLLVDTNIVIDLLAKRIPFYKESGLLFSLADKNKLTLTISALTFANTNYILSRLKSAKEAQTILRKFKVLVETLALDDKITELALNDEKFKDFEDGLQYYTAIENQIDVILTRNQKDFRHSKLPVMNAKEYLAGMNIHGNKP